MRYQVAFRSSVTVMRAITTVSLQDPTSQRSSPQALSQTLEDRTYTVTEKSLREVGTPETIEMEIDSLNHTDIDRIIQYINRLVESHHRTSQHASGAELRIFVTTRGSRTILKLRAYEERGCQASS